jgi:lipopolysaccharide transport system permease protein
MPGAAIRPVRNSTVSRNRPFQVDVELLVLLVLKELRVRYKGSVLGYVWTLANPLAFALVYYVTFQVIMRVGIPNYGVYLLTGLFPWSCVASSLILSASAYRGNENLVKKVRIPRAVLPLATAVHEMLHLCFAVPILIVALVLADKPFHLSWLLVAPVMALVQVAMLYPLGLLLAAANVLVRDVEYMVAIILQLLFFLTPIVYEQTAIPQRFTWLFALNPFSWLIAAWRTLFYEGALDSRAVGLCLAFAAVTGAAAWMVHARVNPRIGELL